MIYLLQAVHIVCSSSLDITKVHLILQYMFNDTLSIKILNSERPIFQILVQMCSHKCSYPVPIVKTNHHTQREHFSNMGLQLNVA